MTAAFDGISAAAPTSFSTYLPTRSASRLTRAPGSSRPSVVTARVCGMSATAKVSSSQAVTVRLTPETHTDPFSIV